MSWSRLRAGVKRQLPPRAVALLARSRRFGRDLIDELTAGDRAIALLLRRSYPALVAAETGSALSTYEARWASQNGEDGVLLHLFDTVGLTAGHSFVEIGAGDGRECNSANLALNFGWRGLMIDGDRGHVDAAQRHYDHRLGMDRGRVRIRQAFVTAENVNDVVIEGLAGMVGPAHPAELDLLSIDVDSMDYWLWSALRCVTPRVVVVEFNKGLGGERAVTVPYAPAFDRFDADPTGCFYGASLAALVKLAGAKGYLLAGCESSGTNAFFVRRDIAGTGVPEVAPLDVFSTLPAVHSHATATALEGYVDV